jgi:two-component system OmpR family response regulator
MKQVLIEDDADIRRVASLSLRRLGGMEVVEAAGGVDGLWQVAEARPDAILLDVMMPGMDGPATLAALQAHPRTAAIPVIFLTAKAMPSEIARLRSLGAVGVLTKPFDPLTLAAQVRSELEIN